MKHWWLLPPKEYEEEHIDRLLKQIHRKRVPWMLRHEQLVVTSLSMVLVFSLLTAAVLVLTALVHLYQQVGFVAVLLVLILIGWVFYGLYVLIIKH